MLLESPECSLDGGDVGLEKVGLRRAESKGDRLKGGDEAITAALSRTRPQ